MGENAIGIKSPCIGVCFISPDLNLCYGCLRTIQEIENWTKYSDQERDVIIVGLEARRETLPEEMR